MAGYRQIHTKIWKRDWFLELAPTEKLLFVYLFSNELASVSGIYHISLKVIAFETGLTIPFIKKTLTKLEGLRNGCERVGRSYYRDGVVWVISLRKYNDSGGPKVAKRIETDLAMIPDCELKQAYIAYHADSDTLFEIQDTLSEIDAEHEHEHEQEHEQHQVKSDVDDDPSDFALMATEYTLIAGGLVSERSRQDIGELIDGGIPVEWVRLAREQMEAQREKGAKIKAPWPYCLAILDDWQRNGGPQAAKSTASGERVRVYDGL